MGLSGDQAYNVKLSRREPVSRVAVTRDLDEYRMVSTR
jgi:hypothetical protein